MKPLTSTSKKESLEGHQNSIQRKCAVINRYVIIFHLVQETDYTNNKHSSETHSLELHPQLVVGEFEGSSNGLEIVYQHAETHRDNSKVMLIY